VDLIVARKDMRDTLAKVLGYDIAPV
jgi:hypothetical protein